MSNQRTAHLLKEADLSAYRAVIKCEQPNERIYNFEGSVTTDQECFSLDQGNLLLRAPHSRTRRGFTVSSFTPGMKLKLWWIPVRRRTSGLKWKRAPIKSICTFQSGLAGWQLSVHHSTLIITITSFKVTGTFNSRNTVPKRSLLCFWLTCCSWTPSADQFISHPRVHQIRHGHPCWSRSRALRRGTDTQAVARSSNLMEELGQVQCILTDKTGTLTCNEMILRHLIIEGKFTWTARIPSQICSGPTSTPRQTTFFLKILSTCHTIMIDYSDPLNPCYQGSSPDELAMVNVAADLGYKFINRSVGKSPSKYTAHQSRLKSSQSSNLPVHENACPSSLYSPTVNIISSAKGADSIILERLEPNSANSEQVKKSLKALEKFASDGLRTLCFAYRKLDRISPCSGSINGRTRWTLSRIDKTNRLGRPVNWTRCTSLAQQASKIVSKMTSPSPSKRSWRQT